MKVCLLEGSRVALKEAMIADVKICSVVSGVFFFSFFGDLLSVLHCYTSITRLMELFDAKISQTFLDDLPRICILTSSKGSVGRSVSVTVSWDGMHKDISTLLPPLASNTASTIQRL